MTAIPRSRTVAREVLVFLAFGALTVVMTWPWAVRLRDAVADTGDPYLNSWILWWDFHQTFHDPLHLFDGNIFFPHPYSLAFSEHNYGIALLFFPLFALGARPLMVQGLATLLGFAFSGYGAFRLTRTLTGSTAAAWLAGCAFGFSPYRFHQLPHLNYLFAGWIPILVEALVLFVRERSAKRAAWLGVAFFMNGLTCIHWFVLTLVPLALTAVALVLSERAERDRDLWRRAALALGLGGAGLLPFLVPYARAAKLYGFVRDEIETTVYSAVPRHWLTAEPRLRVWGGFGIVPPSAELCLFPGLLVLLLSLFALLRVPDAPFGAELAKRPGPPRRLLVLLDAVAILAGTVALLAWGGQPFVLRLFDHQLLKASTPTRALALMSVALVTRCLCRYPAFVTWARYSNLVESLRHRRRPDVIAVGVIWTVTGFLGSLGLRFPFHAALFELVPLFRSIRVPARWAMVGHLGLAVLAGAGVLYVAERVKIRPAVASLVASAILLFEVHAVPLDLATGEADPDELTNYVATAPMRGGLVGLPLPQESNYHYILRAADHGKPLVDAVSGFVPPTAAKLERLLAKRPIPLELLDLLEAVPVSFVAVRDSWLDPDQRDALRRFLAEGLESGRLRFVRRFEGRSRDELYAVVKTEPGVSGGTPPWDVREALPVESGSRREDPGLLGAVDVPADSETVKGTLHVIGWARIPGEDMEITIFVDGVPRAPAPSSVGRFTRPDVAQALPFLGDCSHAGYSADFPFEPGDEGAREILVVFRTRDGRVRHFPFRRFTWKP